MALLCAEVARSIVPCSAAAVPRVLPLLTDRTARMHVNKALTFEDRVEWAGAMEYYSVLYRLHVFDTQAAAARPSVVA